MAEAHELPAKRYYKVSEVCRYTDTQPYVLSFWESEFPQLNPEKTRNGQSMYTKRDIDVVMRIKQLLDQEEHTIAGARERLEQERTGKVQEPATKVDAGDAERAPGAPRSAATDPEERDAFDPPLPFDSVSRERYEDAVDEIAHLRLQLKEAETQARRAGSASAKAEKNAEEHRRRLGRALATLQRVLELLS